ncbi:stage II sporulation protein P [Paenibacillus hodogayensis]|uniref:Stage II sporulation protein P n=1 Tax=Paenibacillus hodogayensis TaxID=279208 RepID=A0ABV5VT67_9BACL
MSMWTRWVGVWKSERPGRVEGSVLRRVFAAYIGVALLLLALAAATALWQAHATVKPKNAMKRMAASVSPQFFIDMLGLEAAPLKRSGETTFTGKKIGGYLAESLLHVNPVEPKSLLASEMPGMRGRLMASGTAQTANGSPEPPGLAGTDGGQTVEAGKDHPGTLVPDAGTGAGTGAVAAAPPTQEPIVPQPTGTAPVAEGSEPASAPAHLTTEGRKVVFVYHSHPRESWVPELNVQNAGEAENAKTNITLVGRRLVDKLEALGIGSQQSNTDYPTAVQGYNWNYSYKYSLQTVKEAFAQNKDIAFLFDIHRDSAGRDVTTAKIGGTDYAKVYFIVGKKNERWEQNEAFAKRINEKLEADYPGLSRGIWDKGSGGHAEYNQSLSPNSILIEVGGPYNTLEESYRTADVLAKTIAGLYWDAEKVNAVAKTAAGASTALAVKP